MSEHTPLVMSDLQILGALGLAMLALAVLITVCAFFGADDPDDWWPWR